MLETNKTFTLLNMEIKMIAAGLGVGFLFLQSFLLYKLKQNFDCPSRLQYIAIKAENKDCVLFFSQTVVMVSINIIPSNFKPKTFIAQSKQDKIYSAARL